MKTKNDWLQVKRSIKKTSKPKGYRNTNFISDETFLFAYNDTEPIAVIVEDEYHDYVTLFLAPYSYLKNVLKIPAGYFISENEKLIKLINEYEAKDNKLDFSNRGTYDEKEFIYALRSKIDHDHLSIINESCLSRNLKIEIKLVTSFLINFYYGQCDDPFTRIDKYPNDRQRELKRKLSEMKNDFVMCVIDPLIYNHFNNEKMLIQFSKKNPFDENFNTITPVLQQSSLKLDYETKNWSCVFFHKLFSESSFIIPKLEDKS